MKQEKVELTTMNLILSIIGILLLTLVIILPPIFRVVFKEDEKPKDDIIVDYPTLTTTCYKENIETDTSIDNETYIFQYKNNMIKSYTKSITKKYSDPNNYEIEKQSFGRLVSAYSVLDGYNYTVNPNDEASSLTIQENYDLSIFQSTMIVIPGSDTPTEVTPHYFLNTVITDIEEELTTSDYLCSQSE